MALQPTHNHRGGFKKGVSGNPAGMKKGTKQRRTLAREIVSKYAGITPLEYMLLTLRDKKSAPRERMWAAKEAAPYVHRKQPQAVEMRDITEEEKDQMAKTVKLLEEALSSQVHERKRAKKSG